MTGSIKFPRNTKAFCGRPGMSFLIISAWLGQPRARCWVRPLEAAGLLSSRHGSGTVVADRVSPLAQGEKDRILEERIGALLS